MDNYVIIITALLPLAALMVVLQVNPYRALVMRGILGALAALTYTLLGAPDVALTEALVGTLLAITLYAVAVRSSLVLRLGVLEEDDPFAFKESSQNEPDTLFQSTIKDIQAIFRKRHMRLELVPYANSEQLQHALVGREVHAICVRSPATPQTVPMQTEQPYHTTTRLRRLYEILQAELTSSLLHFSHSHLPQSPHPGEKQP